MVSKKDIENLIVQRKKSNLKNHWKDSININKTKYSGEIRPNEVLLWSSAAFLRGTYPIFHLKFDKDGKLYKIRLEKNPFNQFLYKITIGFYLVLTLVFFMTFKFKIAMFGFVGYSIIGFLIFLAFRNHKKTETKILMDELKQAIKTIEKSNNFAPQSYP